MVNSFSLHRVGTVCTGLHIKPYTGEISGLKLQPVTPFQWSEAPEASQASHYLPHIGSHLQQILNDKKLYVQCPAIQDAADSLRYVLYKSLQTFTGVYHFFADVKVCSSLLVKM